jgi:hypothetical protein
MWNCWQTGSGKTHTMLGDISDLDHQPSDKRGMTPRVFESLFTKIKMVFSLPACLVVEPRFKIHSTQEEYMFTAPWFVSIIAENTTRVLNITSCKRTHCEDSVYPNITRGI